MIFLESLGVGNFIMIKPCQWVALLRVVHLKCLAQLWNGLRTMVHLNIPHLIHILDDFLMAAHTFVQCRINLEKFLQMCAYLCVPIAQEKTSGPQSILIFAGIELDTVRMEARLPQDKIGKCHSLVSSFLTRKKVQLKELQSLIGLLNFACSVIVPGGTFLRRLIDLTKGVRSAKHFIRLRNWVKGDLSLWKSFLDDFNGRSMFLNDKWHDSRTLNLYTDAAGSLGFGAICGPYWAMAPGRSTGKVLTLRF